MFSCWILQLVSVRWSDVLHTILISAAASDLSLWPLTPEQVSLRLSRVLWASSRQPAASQLRKHQHPQRIGVVVSTKWEYGAFNSLTLHAAASLYAGKDRLLLCGFTITMQSGTGQLLFFLKRQTAITQGQPDSRCLWRLCCVNYCFRIRWVSDKAKAMPDIPDTLSPQLQQKLDHLGLMRGESEQ